MRRAAVANVNCLVCGKHAAGVVSAARDEKSELGLVEICLACLDDMFDVGKLLQMRIRESERRSRSPDYGPDWGRIHDAIIERDGGCCQDADHQRIEGGGAGLRDSVVVHHIKPLKEFGGDYISANQPENLITLCSICHGRWHSALYYSKKLRQRG